jgi:hypothetical protein
MAKPRATTWNDLKAELAQFDCTGLLGLLKDLYALRPENRAFLAARFGVGIDPLTPFKKVISRWIYPDPMKGQDISVSKAKKAIADCQSARNLDPLSNCNFNPASSDVFRCSSL